ncbi:ribosomal subunit interface protein [candidate division MSBL1 archaeon SCGC-AAA259A05]|uniref:RNA 3'-terminal phosphate cyclase n=1 Tax=candidate division MSBL1 archaeon SCGC-AAA259A05 TaxID=1698259 RepID=A0A133U9Q3_9EURY|nr:ribosomal subunit interface protein [candidate division MSBL1 archaeon SCGC-AAA259A05]
MLEIDGSMGEGGGSILRISLALSAVSGQSIKVRKIRANRPKPGLSNQHLKAVEALQKLTDGETEGAEIRSKEVTFRPKTLEGGKIKVDIGTAGSTTLILQALMPPAAFVESPVNAEIIGGTDNPFAPPIDYLMNVTLPMLKKLGYRGKVKGLKRGHYPKGGGKIEAGIKPVEKFQPLNLTEAGEIDLISGISHCVKLPGHIAKRQAEAASKKLEEDGYDSDIEVEYYKKSEDFHLSPGTGIVLWVKTENGAILGSSSLGEKGKPAEKVGKEAAKELIDQMETGCAFDRYLTDQIIPYLAMAEGKSEISSAELTSHALTNIKLVRKILGTKIDVTGRKGKTGRIKIEGS